MLLSLNLNLKLWHCNINPSVCLIYKRPNLFKSAKSFFIWLHNPDPVVTVCECVIGADHVLHVDEDQVSVPAYVVQDILAVVDGVELEWVT